MVAARSFPGRSARRGGATNLADQHRPAAVGRLSPPTTFGYRGLLWVSLRLKNTFDTLDRMERYRGHFLNWYDTATLEPLLPRYVSTVDSGNLARLSARRQTELHRVCRIARHRAPAAWDGLARYPQRARGRSRRRPRRSRTARLGRGVKKQLARPRAASTGFKQHPLGWCRAVTSLLQQPSPQLEPQLAMRCMHTARTTSAPAADRVAILGRREVHRDLERMRA